MTDTQNLTNFFLLFALLAFLFDVFFRRFSIVTQRLENILTGWNKNEHKENKKQFEQEIKKAQKRQQKTDKKQKTEQNTEEVQNNAAKLAAAKKKRKR